MSETPKKRSSQVSRQDTAGKTSKKKKKANNDAIVILVIISVIILITILMALFSSGNNIQKVNMAGGRKNPDKDADMPLEMIFLCGFFTVFIIALLIIKKIRDKKRKAKLKAEQMEKARKMQELKEAKERVRRAKMNEFLTAGENELEKRKKEEELLRNKKNRREHTGLGDSDRYSRRDLNEFRDELPELETYEDENFIKRIVRKIKNRFSRGEEED